MDEDTRDPDAAPPLDTPTGWRGDRFARNPPARRRAPDRGGRPFDAGADHGPDARRVGGPRPDLRANRIGPPGAVG